MNWHATLYQCIYKYPTNKNDKERALGLHHACLAVGVSYTVPASKRSTSHAPGIRGIMVMQNVAISVCDHTTVPRPTPLGRITLLIIIIIKSERHHNVIV